MTSSEEHISVADFVARQLAVVDKSQAQIARECEFPRPNMIWMIKTGKAPVPLAKIGLLAKSLGVDPLHFLRLVMSEYQPNTWAVISEAMGNKFVTDDEMKLIWQVRAESFGAEVCPETDEEIEELRTMVKKWRARRIAQLEADAVEAKPGRPKSEKSIEKIKPKAKSA